MFLWQLYKQIRITKWNTNAFGHVIYSAFAKQTVSETDSNESDWTVMNTKLCPESPEMKPEEITQTWKVHRKYCITSNKTPLKKLMQFQILIEVEIEDGGMLAVDDIGKMQFAQESFDCANGPLNISKHRSLFLW